MRFDSKGEPVPRLPENSVPPATLAADDPCTPTVGAPATYQFPCTPVARYLTQIAYTGLVPGIRDFYFGAPLLYHLGNTLGRTDSILPMLGANLVLCDQKANRTPTPPPPQAQILLPTQASLPSSVSLGSGSGPSGKGKSGGASAGGQSGGPSSGGASGSASQSPSASTSTAFGCDAGGPTGSSGGQVASTGAAMIVYPSANSIYPWTTRLVLAIPEQFDTISSAMLQSGSEFADCQTSFPITVIPSSGDPASDSSKPCPSPGTAPCAVPLPSPRTMPHDTRGLKLYLVDLCGFEDVSAEGTVPRTDDVNKSPRPILAPGSKLQLVVDLTFAKNVKRPRNGKETKNGRETTLRQIIPFTVQQPFFDHAWRCLPTSCIADDGNPEYVVFGVADPTMQSEISKVNLQADLYDGKKAPSLQHTFTVDFNDASSALSQAAQAFEASEPERRKKWEGTHPGATKRESTVTVPSPSPDDSRCCHSFFKGTHLPSIHLWSATTSVGSDRVGG